MVLGFNCPVDSFWGDKPTDLLTTSIRPDVLRTLNYKPTLLTEVKVVLASLSTCYILRSLSSLSSVSILSITNQQTYYRSLPPVSFVPLFRPKDTRILTYKPYFWPTVHTFHSMVTSLLFTLSTFFQTEVTVLAILCVLTILRVHLFLVFQTEVLMVLN